MSRFKDTLLHSIILILWDLLKAWDLQVLRLQQDQDRLEQAATEQINAALQVIPQLQDINLPNLLRFLFRCRMSF